MGTRRSRLSAGNLDKKRELIQLRKGVVLSTHPVEDISSVDRQAAAAEHDQTESSIITPRKPSQKGTEGRARARISSKGRQTRDDGNDDGDRGIVIVGEKATASTRGDPAAVQNADGTELGIDEETARQVEQEQRRSGFAELVQAEIERTSGVQKLEHLKERAAHALKEVSVVRAKLDRAEAAVSGSKKRRDVDVAERETQLRRYEEEIRRLTAEGEFYRVQLGKSVEDGTRLGDELKRTQESLLFLSAWDEEKIELEAEVATLKAQLSSATEDGNKRLERAQHEFNIVSATAGQKARLRLARDTEKIRLDLERGLSEEFKTLRRENDVLRRERAHKDSEINRIMKNAGQIESDQRAARAELDDERRMHHRTIRRKKQAEAVITELQAQLSMALSTISGKPCPPSNISLSPTRPKKQWNSPRAPAPVRGKMLIRGGDGDDRYREAYPGNSRRSTSKVSMLLVSAGTGRRRAEEGGEEGSGEKFHAARIATGAAGIVASPAQDKATGAAATRLVNGRRLDLPPESARSSMRLSDRNGEAVGVAESRHDGSGRITCHQYVGGYEESGEKGDPEDIPELLPCGSSSEITSGDVWGMLDSYVHRRSEVARANRHLRVIEAMRKHLGKTTAGGGNPTGSHYISPAVKNNGRVGRKRMRVSTESCESTKGEESVWKICRLGGSSTKGQRTPVIQRRPTHKKTAAKKPNKLRVRYEPHPPTRCERDASTSSLSQITAVSSWRECGTDGQAIRSSRTLQPRDRNSLKTIPPSVSRDDEGRGRGGASVTTAGLRDDGLRGCGATTITTNCGSRRDRGGRARRGGSLTSPSWNTEDAGGGSGRPSPPDVAPDGLGSGKDTDSTILFAQQHQQHHRKEEGVTSSIVARSPSPTKRGAITALRRVEKTGAEPGATRLRGGGDAGENRRGGGLLGVPQPRGNGSKARKGNKAAGFKCGRRTELADWIETNTNLVNVSPW
ncbi:unnamed protein product [Hapterophycus canaliculatus]